MYLTQLYFIYADSTEYFNIIQKSNKNIHLNLLVILTLKSVILKFVNLKINFCSLFFNEIINYVFIIFFCPAIQ